MYCRKVNDSFSSPWSDRCMTDCRAACAVYEQLLRATRRRSVSKRRGNQSSVQEAGKGVSSGRVSLDTRMHLPPAPYTMMAPHPDHLDTCCSQRA